jgi:hypothetical protein
VADGLFLSPTMIAMCGWAPVPRGVRARMTGLFAAASCGAYPVSVRARTIARFALMTALRVPSIQFAILIGCPVFGEWMTPGKGLAALTIGAGVIVTRL